MLKIIITAQDGYPISALLGISEGNKGTVILSSATCIKKEFYIKFAQFLNQNGYTVVLFDYRGIGESAPYNLKDSKIFMHEWGTKDMNAVLNYVIKVIGPKNITWMGHSIGAQLVGFLEQAHHVKRVISINAAVGYWGYFPFPMNVVIWTLWYVIGPLLLRVYGYGEMKKIGWGENLPKYAILEWRKWCIRKDYYRVLLQRKLQKDSFDNFTTPMTVVYLSDDYIANDKTVSLMMEFFPNAPTEVIKIDVKSYTEKKVGHTGIFRKKFEKDLWPVLTDILNSKPIPT